MDYNRKYGQLEKRWIARGKMDSKRNMDNKWKDG